MKNSAAASYFKILLQASSASPINFYLNNYSYWTVCHHANSDANELFLS